MNINLTLNDSMKLGVAVSGGRDSMALMHYIASVLDSSRVIAINIEHGIRDIASQQDSQFVIEQATQLGIECISISVDTLKYSKERKLSIEQAARELRYIEFNKIISSGKADRIALAHHKQDQCETIMMRILRGTGINGLCGMSDIRDDIYIRPMLDVTRDEVNNYIKEHNIPYVEDETNNDSKYTRNFIRNELFPLIGSRYPDYESALIRLSINAREDNAYILSNTNEPVKQGSQVILPINNLSRPKSLVSREIIKCFNLLNVIADIERRHLDAIINMKSLSNGSYINMPYSVKVYREYDKLVFVRDDIAINNVTLPFQAGRVQLNGTAIDIVEYQGKGLMLDIDKIPSDAVIRYRQESDYIEKFGGGKKRLGDYMTDIKIPKRIRDTIPLIAIGNEILALGDYEISRKLRVNNDTKRVYTIIIRRTND